MSGADIVLADFSDIREEASCIGKPVLVMRDTTERPDVFASGAVHFVSTDCDIVYGLISPAKQW